MPTAVCLLGSIRTLSCTGRMTLERIVHPFDGTLFAFVNVPQQWSQTRIVQTRALIATLARSTGVRLAISEVVNNVPNSPYRGMAQYHGLQRCWAVASQTALYETIIRVQTDVYHGLFLSPRVLANIKHANIIYAGWVGAPSCPATTRSSTKRSRAHAVDDRFAIVHGRLAQQAYFSEFSKSLAEFADRTAEVGDHLTDDVRALAHAARPTCVVSIGGYDLPACGGGARPTRAACEEYAAASGIYFMSVNTGNLALGCTLYSEANMIYYNTAAQNIDGWLTAATTSAQYLCCGFSQPPTSECLLGMAINDVNDEVSNRPDLQIKLSDIRNLTNGHGTCTKAHAQIIRSNCSVEVESVLCTRREYLSD